jgi:hypothetical protein
MNEPFYGQRSKFPPRSQTNDSSSIHNEPAAKSVLEDSIPVDNRVNSPVGVSYVCEEKDKPLSLDASAPCPHTARSYILSASDKGA